MPWPLPHPTQRVQKEVLTEKQRDVVCSVMNKLCDLIPRFYPSLNHLALSWGKACQALPQNFSVREKGQSACA